MAYFDDSRYELLSSVFPKLTDVQTQCVLMYSVGMSTVEISESVGVSQQQINKTLHAAAKKMNVQNLIGLKAAVQIGLMLSILANLKRS